LQYIVSPWEQLGANVYVPYPDRYQLGPGDMLTVTISSPYIDAQNIDVKLDAQGAITIPTGNMKLVLRGKTLGEAEKLVSSKVALVLKGGRATLMLKELRTMTVTIAGDAYVPGEYQMPAVATLFDTIYVCGGPADSGSLRKIELRHNDGTKQTFDLYDYLVLGKKSLDVPLQPGDVIWFAPAQTRVSIKGEVPRPDVYEALPTDSLKNLVAFAGGAKATGVDQRVYLQTEDAGVGHIVKDVDVRDDGNSGRLYDGDVATILSTRPDYVLDDLTMNGDVEQPGTYQYVKGETVADLIDKARGLRPDAYKLRADVLRLNPDQSQTLIEVDLPKALARNPDANVQLQAHDTVKVYAISDAMYVDNRQINIDGDVQKPQQYTRKDNERVADLILEAGGTWPDAFLDIAYLKRVNKDGTEGNVIPLNLKRVFAGDPSQNVVLQDHDDLTIQSNMQAHYMPDQSVNILGAIQAPGNYQNNNNLRVSDLIQQAGGALPNAGGKVEISHARVPDGTPRVTLRLADVLSGAPGANPVLLDGDLVTLDADSNIDMNGPRKVVVVGEVAHPGAFAISRTDRLDDVIKRAGGVVSDGFVQGAQFYRDPTKLVSDTQNELSPRLQSVMAVVAADEYVRAIALSAVSKAQFLSSVNSGGSSFPIPGIGTASTGGSAVQVPSDVFEQQSVTPARTLTVNDLTPVGNINIRLDAALRNPKSSENLLMADGDIIVIPRTPATVSIVGAVTVPSAVKYVPDHTVGYYLTASGGTTIDAAKDNIVVIRAGGLVIKANRSTKIGLGDQIYVPTQVMSVNFTNKLAEAEGVTKNIVTGAIVLALLKAFL
jgi:protein involved in polysaccharide export with SLBB domain